MRAPLRFFYRGFTLIEMVVVMAIVGVVAVAVTPMIMSMFESYTDQRQFADTDAQARLALERMLRELRTVRTPADLSAPGASISFTDVNGNAIAYSLSGTQLLRDTDVLATGVANLAFSYFDRTGAPVAGGAAPYYIRAQFTLAPPGGNARNLIGEVLPRTFL